MFTGIIGEKGEITAVKPTGDSVRVTVRAPGAVAKASHGDSIAVSGVCLTVIAQHDGSFDADVMGQTIAMSNPDQWSVGRTVNIESAMALGEQLGGHIVQGHVDATTHIVSRVASDHWEVVRFDLPDSIARYVAARGSIAVDGVSLTISELDANQKWFEVSLIPTTLGATTLGSKVVGDIVNLESDIVARHVERLMQVQVQND